MFANKFLGLTVSKDMLLIAAETEKRLGYDVIAVTVQTIYLGASDTLA